jgi:hypothetical protein
MLMKQLSWEKYITLHQELLCGLCEQKEQAYFDGGIERSEPEKWKVEEELEKSKEDIDRLWKQNQKERSGHQFSEIGFIPLGR